MNETEEDTTKNDEIFTENSSFSIESMEKIKEETKTETEKWDSKIILILTATLLSNLCYIIVAPFLPLNFEAKGIDEDVIGIIFAIYPISAMVSSLLLAKHGNKFSKVKIISISLSTMGLCFISFGLLNMIESNLFTSIFAIMIRAF